MFKIRSARAAALALILATGAAAALAQSSGGPIRIAQARIPQPPNGAPTASGYATLTNKGREPDRLMGASSPCCDRVELHQMSMGGGVMTMRPVPGGVDIAPGATLSLSPNGYHLMLIHPHQPLQAGLHIPVTLRFQHSAETADFVVQSGRF